VLEKERRGKARNYSFREERREAAEYRKSKTGILDGGGPRGGKEEAGEAPRRGAVAEKSEGLVQESQAKSGGGCAHKSCTGGWGGLTFQDLETRIRALTKNIRGRMCKKEGGPTVNIPKKLQCGSGRGGGFQEVGRTVKGETGIE